MPLYFAFFKLANNLVHHTIFCAVCFKILFIVNLIVMEWHAGESYC